MEFSRSLEGYLAGGKKFDVLKAMELRDKKLEQANKLFIRMQKLEDQAEDLDFKITEHCDHPKTHLKLKRFTNEVPQKTHWLCTVCYQSVEVRVKNKIKDNVENTFEEIADELPSEALSKDLKTK